MTLSPYDLISGSQSFFPHAAQRRANLLNNLKLAHYTSADVAVQIIEKQEIWLRRATVMNDFREIQYGRDTLFNTVRSRDGQKYQNYVNNFYGTTDINLEEEVIKAYDRALSGTYIVCFSEHHEKEDEIGRLSMWRAYGGQTGVAIIIKPAPIKTKEPVGVISMPVTYPPRNDIIDELNAQKLNMENNRERFEKFSPEDFRDLLGEAFRFAVISTKHRGFAEELEWRSVYEPRLEPPGKNREEIRSIRGTLQPIKIHSFKNFPTAHNNLLSLPDIIDRIIIGPTYHPEIMRDGFIELLRNNGFKNPDNYVFTSEIPLRYY